jgi:glycosyltransferase involved in cell wall biosynthesis
MLVSVIIPTYNRVQFILRAVNSVLRQSHSQLELIVVDDGSTDGSREELLSIKDPRFKLLFQENLGVSAARNAGIEASSAHILALLDSDDYWLPEKLERQLEFMMNGNWAICQTDEIWVRHGSRVNPAFKHAKRAGWIFEPSLELCLISPSCVLFTRDLWRQMGPFDQALPACEDYDLWLRTALVYPVGFLPHSLVVKEGGHADQLSRKIIGLDLYRIYSILNLLKGQKLDRSQKIRAKKVLEEKGRRYVQGCLKRDKPEEGWRVNRLVAEQLKQ